MILGEKLRRRRVEKQMSIYRLTQLTGVSGQHSKGIEEGAGQPTIETLDRLVTALGSTLSEIFNEDGAPVYVTERERRLLENFRTLSDEKADALLNVSDMLTK